MIAQFLTWFGLDPLWWLLVICVTGGAVAGPTLAAKLIYATTSFFLVALAMAWRTHRIRSRLCTIAYAEAAPDHVLVVPDVNGSVARYVRYDWLWGTHAPLVTEEIITPPGTYLPVDVGSPQYVQAILASLERVPAGRRVCLLDAGRGALLGALQKLPPPALAKIVSIVFLMCPASTAQRVLEHRVGAWTRSFPWLATWWATPARMPVLAHDELPAALSDKLWFVTSQNDTAVPWQDVAAHARALKGRLLVLEHAPHNLAWADVTDCMRVAQFINTRH